LSPVDYSVSLSLELVGKRALSVLKDNLNTELDAQYTLWQTIDSSLGYPLVRNEYVRPENFYHGHRPSLIDAPVDKYPNVCSMAWQATPEVERLDEMNKYQIILFIESMCKSVEDEEELNSRVQRMTDAIHTCFMKNKSLGGTTVRLGDTPRATLSEIFVRPEIRGHGDRFLWQGSRLEYSIEKYAEVVF
jgi:hypothetical protein